MKAFSLIWLGQVVSLLGSAMTWFAFTIWAWRETSQATALSTVSFFAFLPTVLLTPVAGALVDRWDRKRVMLFSDMATALATLLVLLLYRADALQLWHIYAISILAGFFTAFQYPAYTAAVTTMLPREDYTRAEAMLGLATALSGILAPVFAAALLGRIGMDGIMLVDLATFLAAFAALLVVEIPRPAASEVGRTSRGSLWQETLFGFGYIRQRRGLRGLAILFMAGNFFIAIGATLLAPMILNWSGDSESLLANVQSLGAVGGVTGGALLTFWGGPKRRIHGVLLGGIGAGLLGILWLGLGRGLLVWAIGSFFFSFFEPFVESGNVAIWQSKVEADVQGRVFAARHLLVQIPYLAGILVSGPLAERGLGSLFHYFDGTSPEAAAGNGIAFGLALAGFGAAAVFGSGYAFASIRKVEEA
jgi:MFS family permease